MKTPTPAPSGIWAVRSLLTKIHTDMECPEVRLEEDGDIGFDWDHSRDCTISAHVNDDGRVGWAALIGEYRTHGRFNLPQDCPAEFVDAMQRYVATRDKPR